MTSGPFLTISEYKIPADSFFQQMRKGQQELPGYIQSKTYAYKTLFHF